MTPDPIGAVNWSDPGSSNTYAYVQSDPVSFVDPLGLQPQAQHIPCADGRVSLGGRITSLREVFKTDSKFDPVLGALAIAVFGEASPGLLGDEAAVAEMSLIVAVILNRFQIVNGNLTVYSADGSLASTAGLGVANGSLAGILATGQFATFQNTQGVSLQASARVMLDIGKALGSDAGTAMCDRLVDSLWIAYSSLTAFNSLGKDAAFVWEDGSGDLYLPTSFNSFQPGSRYFGPSLPGWGEARLPGTAGLLPNYFYGIPFDRVGRKIVP